MASAIFRAFRAYKDKVEQTSVVINNQLENEKRIESEISAVNENIEQVEYCIQIKSSTKQIPLNSRVFKNIQNIQERKIDGIYKYTVGSTSKYSEILILQKTIRKKIKDCFVVAFYKGKRISITKAKELQKT